jgi:hypothetical protein
MLDSGEDEKSPKVSLASITCIRQNCKNDDKVTIHKEVKPPTTSLYPTSSRNSGTIHNSQDGKPMILQSLWKRWNQGP